MKKLILSAALLSGGPLFVVSQVEAALLYQYNRLALKDLDQMNKLVTDKINQSEKTDGDKMEPLKEAFQAVYSRPNEDFMIEKVISPLRNKLDEQEAYEDTVRELVREAISGLKNPKSLTAVAQVTQAIFLENLIAEMRPNAADNFEKSILTEIRDAKIELTKAAQNERRLRMMKGMQSPSTLAGNVLKKIEESEAAKKKEEKAKKKEEGAGK